MVYLYTLCGRLSTRLAANGVYFIWQCWLSSGPLGFQILRFFELVYILLDGSGLRLMKQIFTGPAGNPAGPVKLSAGPVGLLCGRSVRFGPKHQHGVYSI